MHSREFEVTAKSERSPLGIYMIVYRTFVIPILGYLFQRYCWGLQDTTHLTRKNVSWVQHYLLLLFI